MSAFPGNLRKIAGDARSGPARKRGEAQLDSIVGLQTVPLLLAGPIEPSVISTLALFLNRLGSLVVSHIDCLCVHFTRVRLRNERGSSDRTIGKWHKSLLGNFRTLSSVG